MVPGDDAKRGQSTTPLNNLFDSKKDSSKSVYKETSILNINPNDCFDRRMTNVDPGTEHSKRMAHLVSMLPSGHQISEHRSKNERADKQGASQVLEY